MSKRLTVLFVFSVLLIAAVLIALGAWQWSRRSEKLAFIAAMAEAAKGPPKSIIGAGIWDRVELRGRYLPDKVAYVLTSRAAPARGARDAHGQVPVSGFGVYVMHAFEAEICRGESPCRASIMMVNRGFLPTPPNGEIQDYFTPLGVIKITGFVRPGEKETIFPPKNDPAKGIYFYRTAHQIARALELPGAANPETGADQYAAFIDRQADPGEKRAPMGIEITDFLKAIPNNHLEYAITWWSLAGTNLLIAVFFLFGLRAQREDADKHHKNG